MTETHVDLSEIVDLDLDVPCFWRVKPEDSPCSQPAAIQIRYACPGHNPAGRIKNICQEHYKKAMTSNMMWTCQKCSRRGPSGDFFTFLRLL